MPTLKLAFTLATAAYAIGKYFLDGKGDDPLPPPPRELYHSSSSYNSGTSQTHLPSARSASPDAVEELELAKRLREKARHSGWEMAEAYSEADSAERMGDLWAAQEYRQQGHAHKIAMEELDKRAAKIIFREKNKNRGDGMIDLHGLYVAEATRFAREQLGSARLRGDEVVRFIVGKGLHADSGGARIRPAVEKLCTEYVRHFVLVFID
ncbi:hypothetical protein BJY52DRAFT_1210374 [Lactarius psammicola]|nr:hypothetical protein BJY52DRAFT_1210374 [Lactarius psammicola]